MHWYPSSSPRKDRTAIWVVAVSLAAILLSASQLFAGEADVVGVEVRRDGDAAWRFDVTVLHADTGWDHYADKWDVIGPDDTVYGERVLLHPHVGEQPFTRSLGGVRIPDDVGAVTVRAHDSVHGYGGRTLTVDLGAYR